MNATCMLPSVPCPQSIQTRRSLPPDSPQSRRKLLALAAASLFALPATPALAATINDADAIGIALFP